MNSSVLVKKKKSLVIGKSQKCKYRQSLLKGCGKRCQRNDWFDPTATLLQHDVDWWHFFFFLSIPATFCRPYRLSLWFLHKSFEPRLNIMRPQWHSELWDMRQCPGPVTTTANQRCSQIRPTCCGPEWLTPLGTTCAHSIRREGGSLLWETQRLDHWFDPSFCFYVVKPQLNFSSPPWPALLKTMWSSR